MLDLNQEYFAKAARITEEDIFSQISEEAVFKYYVKNLVIGKAIESPLKVKDNHPSFGVYYGSTVQKLMFKDQSLDLSGDCIEFVRHYYRLGSRYEAMSKIALDFRIQGDSVVSRNVTRSIIQPSKSVFEKSNYKKGRTIIDITSRNWESHDIDFWKQFGISIKTLNLFHVKPVRFIFINGSIFSTDKYAYAYKEVKDGELTYKIYQPFNTRKQKWINNNNSSVHQGYTLLPKKEDLLIITKALKDVMSLFDVVNIPSVGVQNENIIIKESVMDEYFSRFSTVITLFDNDKAGKRLSEQYKTTYNMKTLFIPKEFGVKDFSDLVKKVGEVKANEILTKLIKG